MYINHLGKKRVEERNEATESTSNLSQKVVQMLQPYLPHSKEWNVETAPVIMEGWGKRKVLCITLMTPDHWASQFTRKIIDLSFL